MRASSSTAATVTFTANFSLLRVPLALLAMLSLAACEKGMQDMYDQPRYKPYAASPLFADGSSARMPPPGSLPAARGPMAGPSSGRLGVKAVRADADALAAEALPPALPSAMLRRGQQRYDIYCLPCHSPLGDGDGLVVRRGFPAPPSFHEARLRAAPDRYFFDVISNGYGIMYAYGDRVAPTDRWAIVAYIRALQLARHAEVEKLPAALRAASFAPDDKEATP